MVREARAECVIEAPISYVWRVLTNVSQYPLWNPFIIDVSTTSFAFPEEGIMTFVVQWEDGSRVTSKERVTIYETDGEDSRPTKRALWAYEYMGPIAASRMVRATRVHELIAIDDVSTRYVTYERFTGWGNRFVPLHKVQAGFDAQTGALKREAERIQWVDDTTGTASLWALIKRGTQRCIEAQRNAQPVCMLLFDIDDFKRFNDTYGFGVADDLLVRFSDMLLDTAPSDGMVARTDGKEFAMILPNTTVAATRDVATALITHVDRLWETSKPSSLPDRDVNFTLSCVVTQVTPENTVQRVLEHFEDLMSQAKRRGGHRVVVDNNTRA